MYSVHHKLLIYISTSVFISLYFYFNVDIPLMEYIVWHRTETVATVVHTITKIGDTTYAYGAVLIFFIAGFFVSDSHFKLKSRFAFYSMIWASVFVYLGKFLIGRSRPKLWIHDGTTTFYPFPPLSDIYDYASMPSGHTQVSFTCALILSILFPKYRYIYIGIAIIIGFSRMMITAHWLSDVVMGAVFGSVVPILIYHHFYKHKL